MKIKQILTSLLLFLSLTSLLLVVKISLDQEVMAQFDTSYLEEIESATDLPTFETGGHAKATQQPGVFNITSAIYFVLDFMKFLIGGIAVVMIIITGVRLILARKKIDDVWPKQKEHLIMIVTGFVLIMIADVLVKRVFFGEVGEVYESEQAAIEAARRGTEEVRGIYNVAMMIAGSLAVFMLVISGLRLLLSAGNEEAQTKVKKQITWLVIGLLIIGVAEFVVLDFLFPRQGAQIPSAQKGLKLIKDFTNFISAFVSIAAVIASIYGGYLYVTATGNEEKTGKAKKVLIGAIIALVLSVGAFAIVNTVIQIEPGA